MTPYFFVLFVCVFLTFIDVVSRNKSLKSISFLIFCFIFLLFAGLRWETGTDWENYYSNFENMDNFNFGESGFEILFECLVRFSKLILDSYIVVLFITGFVIILLTAITLNRYSPYPVFSYLLLLGYSINSSGFGYRQDLSIAVIFFSLYFIIKRSLYMFLLTVYIAMLFHQSAIIFIPAYWIYNIKWNKKILIYTLLSITVLYFGLSKINEIASVFSASAAYKVLTYTDMSPEEATMNMGDPIFLLIRGLANRFILVIVPIYIIVSNKDYDSLLFKTLNIMLFGIVLFVIFSPLGIVFLRFTRYFDIFQILVIPMSLYMAKPNARFFLVLFFVIFSAFKYIVVLNDPASYLIYVPYKFVFE